MAEPRWLTKREERAWRGYMRMRALLDLQISRDLSRDSGLSTADYEVLVSLSETHGHRVRLHELAEAIKWSTSRLAHHLDRMSRRDLVRKEEHPENRRAAVVVLTPTGLRTIEEAAPLHLESVRRHFVDLLTEEQIDVLAEATETVIEHLRHPDDATRRRSARRPGDE